MGDEHQLNAIPVNAYLSLMTRIPGVNPEYIEEITAAMPEKGSTARTKETYTILIRSIASRIEAVDKADQEQIKTFAQELGKTWTRAISAHHDRKIDLDARAVSIGVHAWRSLHFKDKKLPIYSLRQAIINDIARLFGLPHIPIEHGVQKEQQKYRAIKADAHAFYYSMALANQFGGKCGKACYNWFEEIRDGKAKMVATGLLTNKHAEIAMRANPDAAKGDFDILSDVEPT